MSPRLPAPQQCLRLVGSADPRNMVRLHEPRRDAATLLPQPRQALVVFPVLPANGDALVDAAVMTLEVVDQTDGSPYVLPLDLQATGDKSTFRSVFAMVSASPAFVDRRDGSGGRANGSP